MPNKRLVVLTLNTMWTHTNPFTLGNPSMMLEIVPWCLDAGWLAAGWLVSQWILDLGLRNHFMVNSKLWIPQKLSRIILLHFVLGAFRILFGKDRTLFMFMVFGPSGPWPWPPEPIICNFGYTKWVETNQEISRSEKSETSEKWKERAPQIIADPSYIFHQSWIWNQYRWKAWNGNVAIRIRGISTFEAYY